MDESTRQIRHLDSMRQALLSAFLPTLVLFLVVPAVGDAQVTTSITSTPGAGNLATIVTHTGNLYDITGGTRPGGGPNLFHSFGDFSVGQGDIANFLNTPVNGSLPLTSNILGRVTEQGVAHTSYIYGTIRTTGFDVGGVQANLFLVNPNGIVFGPHGSINVSGSVSFTTAQYLRLSDGVNSANFYANPANEVVLGNSIFAVDPVVNFGFLSAAPAAYGFLTAPDSTSTITVQGSTLSVLPGQSISLVGGQVVIQGDTLPDGTVQQPAQLSAPNGNILLATAASPGEFNVTTLQALPNVDGASFTSSGSVSLAPGSSIDVHGASSTVWIKGGQLVLSVTDATLSTSENPVENPVPAETIILLSQGSSIRTSNAGTDPGADVQLIASTVHLVDGSLIITRTSGPGRGGDIHLTADSLTLENRSQIFTTNSGLGLVGGDLFLNVGTLNLLGGESGGSVIGSINSTGVDLDEDGVVDVTGVGGNINITVQGTTPGAGSMVLSGGSKITSDARSTSGNGGGISIRTTSLDLGEASIISSSTAGTGHGGDIVVEVQELRVVNDATISSSTTSENLIPAAGGMVTVQGLDGSGSMASSVLLSGLNTGIVSDSIQGLSGDLTVHAGNLTITDGAVISIGSALSGPTGLVTVTADSVLISAGGRIFSQSFAQDAGNVTIKANELTLDNGSIVTSTFSESGGRGGDVVLNGGTVSLTNGASINSQSASDEAPFSTGRAGDITMNVASLTLANQSKITSSSLGTVADAGDAGTITIATTGNTVSLTSGSSITSSTIGEGDAGQVIITAPTLSLNDATITTSTSGVGNAGGITITTTGNTLSLANGSSISSASTGTDAIINLDSTTKPPGTAGNVTIAATGSFMSDASSVATSAEANHGGDISITAQSVQLSGGSLITANSKAPLEVTKLVLKMDANGNPVLDENGQPVLDTVRVGDGNAGNIMIHSGSTFVMNNSSLTTEATQASGGQVVITAPDRVQLINSQISTSVAGSATDTTGGNINIDPQFVVLQNSQILAQAVAGAGGAIDIIATSAFIADPASIVSASSTLGISGTVNIQSPLQNVGGELAALTQEFSSAAALLAQQCAARAADGKFSTFVVAAREGLPAEPGGFLASPSLTAELLGSRLSGRDPQTQLLAVTGLFPKYDARPIQLAKLGGACHRGQA